ncbi:alpha/beta hydrolase [Paracidovorax sp. MALMAid1276]|uniref:alpha/beta hydrolase n=1 Tax=Paracidovorax sp. MALMAid1276 TaxID=3411631 RepID=UPI003B9B3ACD
MLVTITLALTAALIALACALAFGGPRDIAPLASINDPFSGVDFSDVPRVQRYTARDGTSLAWLHYPRAPGTGASGAPLRRVVLVHGSSSRARSLHVLARALAAQGHAVAALDMRGHGDSGTRGQLAYIGQLEDDVEDFLNAVPHAGPQTLMGFSAGGGFTLRFAGSNRQARFDHYVLLSPFLHQDAPTARPDAGGWASVGIPRLVALTLLNRAGISQWNHLPVLRFALDPAARAGLTPSYSYTLAMNFRPHEDYAADIRNARGSLRIVAGQDDELFHADRYAALFADAGNPAPVTLVPGADHMGLTLSAPAVAAVAQHAAPLESPQP